MDDIIHLSMNKGGVQSKNSACAWGSMINFQLFRYESLLLLGEKILVCPLPLMSKGESDLVLLLPSSPKGEIVDIMINVLYLMATHLSQNNSLVHGNYMNLQKRYQM